MLHLFQNKSHHLQLAPLTSNRHLAKGDSLMGPYNHVKYWWALYCEALCRWSHQQNNSYLVARGFFSVYSSPTPSSCFSSFSTLSQWLLNFGRGSSVVPPGTESSSIIYSSLEFLHYPVSTELRSKIFNFKDENLRGWLTCDFEHNSYTVSP